MAKFKNIRTGNILTTNSKLVIAQMSAHPETYAPIKGKTKGENKGENKTPQTPPEE